MDAGIQRRRQKATRYLTEDDDDDGGVHAAAVSTMPPSICAVFKVLDPDEVDESEIKASIQDREKVIGKLRALNLNVDQFSSSDNKFIFVTIGAPDTMLKYEAQEQKERLRLKEEYGGALCSYTAELDEKKAYDKPLDGCELFSSTIQLKLIDKVVGSVPYGGDEKDEKIDFDQLIKDKKVVDYFPLHHARMRMKLILEWANLMTKPQPLEMVREYFGEQIALFYTFYGFYNTMLWIPALTGLVLFGSQAYTYYELSGSLENPFVLVYCVVVSVWGCLFCQLWMCLENTRKHEWDTLEFENEEHIREEFKDSKEVEEAVNEITNEPERFCYPDGTWLPPTGRCRKQLFTYVVIGILNFCVIMLALFIWVKIAQPMMAPENVLMGGIVAGFLNALMTFVIDCVMDGVPELGTEGLMDKLVENELWKTDTQHQDALILKTFYFKVVAKYFALVVVAFFVNVMPILGEDAQCPDWQCMPVLQVMFVTIIVSEIFFQQVQTKLLPVAKKRIESLGDNSALKERAGIKVTKTPMEEQSQWVQASPVVDMYKDKIYQFGYIVMFGVAFPLVPLICLVNNTVDLRARALTLLTQNKRPEPLVAADIGTYQMILEILSTLSILTNTAIVGFTSHGLFFYIPSLTQVDRLWAVVILEHFLLLTKLVIGSVIPTEPRDAILKFETQQEKKLQALKKWDVILEE